MEVGERGRVCCLAPGLVRAAHVLSECVTNSVHLFQHREYIYRQRVQRHFHRAEVKYCLDRYFPFIHRITWFDLFEFSSLYESLHNYFIFPNISGISLACLGLLGLQQLELLNGRRANSQCAPLHLRLSH